MIPFMELTEGWCPTRSLGLRAGQNGHLSWPPLGALWWEYWVPGTQKPSWLDPLPFTPGQVCLGQHGGESGLQ